MKQVQIKMSKLRLINRSSRLMIECDTRHRFSSSYCNRCLSSRWNRLRLQHPLYDTLSSSSLLFSSSSSSSSFPYYADNCVGILSRSTRRNHYIFIRYLSIEKDNNKIRKVDDDDDDADNGAHKIIKDRDIHGILDIGSDSNSNNSNSSNITSNSSSTDRHHDSIDIGSSNISNSRFDDGCQQILPMVESFPKLSSNDKVVAVSTPSLPESSSSLVSPQETPVSSSSSSLLSSPSITTEATATSTEPVVEIPIINPKNVTTIGSTIHYAEQKYEDFEANLMKSINESNQRRFRFLLIGTLLTIIWISTVFGARIRKMLTEETAGLAKETLENESLKIQTQVMMMVIMIIMMVVMMMMMMLIDDDM